MQTVTCFISKAGPILAVSKAVFLTAFILMYTHTLITQTCHQKTVSKWKHYRAKQKKVSASTNMAQIFTGGRSVFFFAENFLYANSICQPLLYKEQGTLVSVASLPEERRCQSWVGRLATFIRVTSSIPLSRASCSSVGAPLGRFRRWCE